MLRCTFIFSYNAVFYFAAHAAPIDPEWLRIGFYKKSLWGGYVSLVSDPGFFLDSRGRRDPQAELAATIRAFQMPVERKHLDAELIVATDNPTEEEKNRVKNTHALCRHPARLEYLLRRQPNLKSSFSSIRCNRLRQFLSRTEAAKVSVVFSSYFLGNPASSFGHTLLRIHNRKFAHTDSELLDTAVGFAAFPTVRNPVLYAFYGLIGLFPGGFSADPYYRKIRAYNDQESRDLWSYTLDMTDSEIHTLIALIWELGSTYVSYYYFTVNCGTLMLDILDAAAPRLHLRDRVPMYVLPSDVVHAVIEEPGLVKERGYRPSVRQQFETRFKALNQSETGHFWKLLASNDPSFLAPHPPESRVRVLDAWADYIEYKWARNLAADEPKASAIKQTALLARAELPLPSAPVNTPPQGAAPDLMHPVRRLSVGFGPSRVLGPLLSLRYRFALHGLTDSDYGLPPNTELTFFEFGASTFPRANPAFYLDEATFFRVASLNPWKPYEKPFSFRAGLGLLTGSDPDFVHPIMGTEGVVGGGFGIMVPLVPSRVLVYILAVGRASASGSYRTSWFRLGLGPQVGLLIHLSHRCKFLVEGTSLYRFFADNRSFSTLLWDLQIGFNKEWSTYVGGSANFLDTRVHGGFRFFY